MSELTFSPDTHVYLLDGRRIASTTEIIAAAGLMDFCTAGEERMQLGSYIHKAIALYDRDELDMDALDPAWRPYLEQWIRFRDETKFEPIQGEIPYYSKVYDFAGTPDKVGMLNGRRVLLDFKSGSPARWHDVQLAAYERLLNENGLRVDRTFKLYLGPDNGLPRLRPVDYCSRSIAWNVFLAALTIHNFKGGK
ncbi:MAG: PD-(D/E)XK nuclease family protein [Desulfobacterales bacterium]|nr:PD-(D/E)XK nuclease family protein [Desulfobacterales bacterium]